MRMFRMLYAYCGTDKRLMLAAHICLLGNTALGLVYPNLLRVLVDDVIVPGRYERVPLLALLVLGIVAVKATVLFLFGHFAGKEGNRVGYRLRSALYRKLHELSFSFYDKSRTGEVLSRLTTDLEAVRHFTGYEAPHLVNYFTCIIGTTAVMLWMNAPLTLFVLVSLIPLAWLAVRMQERIQPAFRAIRSTFGEVTVAAQENISGVRTVKAFAREAEESSKFENRSERYMHSQIEASNTMANFIPLMEMAANLSPVVLMGAGGYLVLTGAMSVGELVAFFGLIWFLISPLWHTGHHISIYTQTHEAVERIIGLLNEHVPIRDIERPVRLDPERLRGHLRFEGVTFRYGDRAPALRSFDLDVPPGSVIGILGETGSGKSTIVQLLMRAYEAQEGRILLDGTDIRDVAMRDLRSNMAVVFQETFLFSATIRDNIAFGMEDAPMERIVEAAKLAQAHDFIMELPKRYDTVVGERGLGLSGGQRQRIAIARALLKRPRFLLLDDATSAVDMETESRIQRSIAGLTDCTVFIIAHRISSVRHADEIIVLDDGAVVQRGRHEQLLRQPGAYADMFRVQCGAMLGEDGGGEA